MLGSKGPWRLLGNLILFPFPGLKWLPRHLLSEIGYWARQTSSWACTGIPVFVSVFVWDPVTEKAILCFPLWQNHFEIPERKREAPAIQYGMVLPLWEARLPVSLDWDLWGICGPGAATSCQRPYPDSMVLALGSSWIHSLPYAVTPTGIKSSLYVRHMILAQPYTELHEFISFPFHFKPFLCNTSYKLFPRNPFIWHICSFWLLWYCLEGDPALIWRLDLINFSSLLNIQWPYYTCVYAFIYSLALR